MNSVHKNTLTPSVLWLMTISSGLVAANNYYNQPLLSIIAKDFKVSESEVGAIAMLTQIGFAVGLLVIVPLGDLLKRKKLIVSDFGFIILALLGMAFSQTILQLYIFSFLIGLSSVTPQVFVPMAASLAKPENRTKSIGFVMSGLLIGILSSRILSGFIGELYGWRAMFFIAAALMVVLWLLIIWKLPEVYPQYKGTYLKLMKSVFYYARTEPVLQAAALRGGLTFASFSAFWTSLVFHLEKAPFFVGSAVAGGFGIIGIAGAMMAVYTGNLAKKFPYFKLTTWFIIFFMLSWAVFYSAGYTYWGLIIGVIILDIGTQAIHIMNQSSIFALHPEANNRLNTVYMTTYFIGGSLGTFLAALFWEHWQWNGVLLVGAGFSVLSLIAHFLYRKVYFSKLIQEKIAP